MTTESSSTKKQRKMRKCKLYKWVLINRVDPDFDHFYWNESKRKWVQYQSVSEINFDEVSFIIDRRDCKRASTKNLMERLQAMSNWSLRNTYLLNPTLIGFEEFEDFPTKYNCKV